MNNTPCISILGKLPQHANSAAKLFHLTNHLLGTRLVWKDRIGKSRKLDRLHGKRGLAALLVDEALKTL
jgi:hypothetical protein